MSLGLPSFRYPLPRLARVSAEILRQFPGRENAAVPRRGLVDLKTLIERIDVTAMNSLSQLAEDLSAAEVETLVYGCLQIPDRLAPKVRHILETRWKPRFAHPLWNRFRAAPGRYIAAHLASLPVERAGAALHVECDPQELSEALRSTNWLQRLGRLAAGRLPLREGCGRLGVGEGSPAHAAIATAAVAGLSPREILREEAAYVATCLRSTLRASPDTFARAVDHYLTALDVSQFQSEVLNFLWREIGRPEEAPAKWQGVSSAARAKFNQWLAIQLLHRIFENDHERLEFWRSFMSRIDRAYEVQAGSTKAIVMIFPAFVAVEFLATGNACYLYTRAEYEELLQDQVETKQRFAHESDLKIPIEGSLTVNSYDNRMLHMGGWQRSCYPIIDSLVRRSG